MSAGRSSLADLAVLALLVALVWGVVTVAREWSGPLKPVAEIHLEARYLPLYVMFSLARGVMAYGWRPVAFLVVLSAMLVALITLFVLLHPHA